MQKTLTAEMVAEALEAVRARRPLVHNITNYVVMNFTANALLAAGASPVMAHAPEEVEEMAGLAGALVLNIGTLSAPWIAAMFAAGRAARARGVPVVLDPVGAGATRLRTDTARRMVEELRPSVLRGNASEILAVAGAAARARGVDSLHGVEEARDAAAALARGTGLVVAVTGAEDYVTDGRREVRVANGDPRMGRVTGTGCAATALTGAFLAVERDALRARRGALVFFGLAGERAAIGAPAPGTYAVRLLDALEEVGPAEVVRGARVAASERAA